ncbi:nucleotidyltransferase domain-containing protein [Actinomadura parmotrematis]|uniref:Nucleotidyltransferase domain-containing protein n=1 Tax=Actinomadura parmotrematis TaxID=2864039 RepID=A0ABS7G3N5_9ACTN|nr:nucleotidyltransferase domain-containing protein [Actinomadura parmotrematis]MBW8487318.1 nucleotidyltransferase domain-containing protein [Actinomadura parmotrematis]
MGIAEDLAAAVRAHPAVRRVEPIGSRARGTATELSDWDYQVIVEDFGELAADLPGIAAAHGPLSAQWDPLGDCAGYLMIFPGPVKVDLVFPEVARSRHRPWRVGPDTLQPIDAHFWDWTLWLVSKRRRGMADRVRGELLKMSRHLLEPLGVATVPHSLEEAADRYVRARARLEARYGMRVPRQLESAVLPLVKASDGDRYRPSDLRS